MIPNLLWPSLSLSFAVPIFLSFSLSLLPVEARPSLRFSSLSESTISLDEIPTYLEFCIRISSFWTTIVFTHEYTASRSAYEFWYQVFSHSELVELIIVATRRRLTESNSLRKTLELAIIDISPPDYYHVNDFLLYSNSRSLLDWRSCFCLLNFAICCFSCWVSWN